MAVRGPRHRHRLVHAQHRVHRRQYRRLRHVFHHVGAAVRPGHGDGRRRGRQLRHLLPAAADVGPDRLQHGSAGALDVGGGARILRYGRRSAADAEPCAGRPARRAAGRSGADLFRAQLRPDGCGRRPGRRSVAAPDLAASLPVAVGRLSWRGVDRVLSRAPDSAGEPPGGRRDPAAARGVPSHAARLLRTARRCPPASGRRGSAVSVDRRDARDGDRRERRRHAQPRAPRPGVFHGAGARAGDHGRGGPQGDRGGGAAARHRQAWRARAHPQQARRPHTGGIRADEAARGRRRRHSVARRVPVPGRTDRPVPSRKLGRHRLSARRGGRGHPDRRTDSLGRRLLRRVDVRSPRTGAA